MISLEELQHSRNGGTSPPSAGTAPPAPMMAGHQTNERMVDYMKKLFTLKNGRLVFYVCVWDCGMYSIERITKSFGGTVATFETLEELKKYAKENNYKIACF